MSSIAGGMLRPIRKIGKRLCFPSAPSSWVCRIVDHMQGLQDCRPKSEILFPFPRDDTTVDKADNNNNNNNNINNVHDDDECYTCPPTRFWGPWDKESFFWKYSTTVSSFLRSQIPEYNNKMASTCTIQIGKHFDVISLLSYLPGGGGDNSLFCLNGDTVEVQHLIGKNLMVFCVHVPVFSISSEASCIWALPFLCTKAFSANGNYEVVVVPRMRHNWATDQDAFHHFLSGFPSSWLAIPFSHALRRDFVCKSLGLLSDTDSICLFVDHTQKVLLHETPYGCHESLVFLNNYNRVPWWKSHSQLHAMLGCDPSDYVCKINNPGSGMLSISELNNKLVGLYLCKNGSFIRTLKLVHQECKSRSMDFEIVLIYLPVCEDYVNPQLFQDAVNHVLHEFKIDNWWVLPYDDFRYRRFKQDRQLYSDDELIIVGPHNEFVDPCGKQVISCFGFNAYPFTREHVVEKEYQETRALTLEYLLGDRFLFCDDDEVIAQELRGKIVLLYMDYAPSLLHKIYFPLLDWYFHTKRTRKSSDFEVVFVDLDDFGDAPLHMPWRWCSFDPQHSAFVKDRLLKGKGHHRGLAAFGKDGQILTLDAQDLLQSCDPDGIQSYKGLRNDVIKLVQYLYTSSGVEFDD